MSQNVLTSCFMDDQANFFGAVLPCDRHAARRTYEPYEPTSNVSNGMGPVPKKGEKPEVMTHLMSEYLASQQ